MSESVLRKAVRENESFVATVQSVSSMTSIADAYHDASSPADGQVVAPPSVLKDVRDIFETASVLEAAIQNEHLGLRASSETLVPAVATDDSVTTLLPTRNGMVDVGIPNETAEAVRDGLRDRFDNGEEFSLRTAPRGVLADEIEERFNPEFRDEFESSVGLIDEYSNIDPVIGLLLLASRQGVQLYELSKLAEDTGISSPATVNRKKQILEDTAIIDSAKEQVAVGHPRLTLHIQDSSSTESVEELFATASERID